MAASSAPGLRLSEHKHSIFTAREAPSSPADLPSLFPFFLGSILSLHRTHTWGAPRLFSTFYFPVSLTSGSWHLPGKELLSHSGEYQTVGNHRSDKIHLKL